MSTDEEKDIKEKRPPRYIGAGLAIGVGVGVAMDNIAVGIAVGLAIGAALESYHKEKRENQEDQNGEDKEKN